MSTLADGILETLAKAADRPVSGEALARGLGVSRAAVWKGVEELRLEGFGIESQKGAGYRLAFWPEKLRLGEVRASLGGLSFGKELRFYEETDSTNRQAARWAEEGAPHGALVVAESQSAGRGRLGREWIGKAGESLLFSLVLRPKIDLSKAPLITFVSAISLADALCAHIDAARIEIKWPNDLLVEGKKVAGILLESRIEGTALDYVILGAGINVLGGGEALPDEIRPLAATVADFAKEKTPRPAALLAQCLAALEKDLWLFGEKGFAPFVERWNGWFRMAGRGICVTAPEGVTRGQALGLCEDGSLLVKTGAGEKKIVAGDVAYATTK
ncbi:biotin--[acetyl-CoA-carboxylase] ligase [bacterium]|nr:MAG: biotin--[acetyl-CoA-carboxylase] ligase [bacterium]